MEPVTLIQLMTAILAAIVLIDVSVLWLTGKQVPELLGQLVLAVFATYFAAGMARPRSGRNGTAGETPAAGSGPGSGTQGGDKTAQQR